ncbi:NAD(P)H-dependent oxidoreductase [Sinomicrobium weinanense]|uniref:NAD(P)H-dependent oxidoreductase n=1 Tax=Sinomicrobium weinanense TaxID=2842200 RepID=A0A926Q2D7_9FLAO|nr:NAD(P)H-dependent oxidoreductase [Sinomicrobium weinanense]MBC9794801.1 NAD(P)H-dependent oxidoreductase [Sinomicrobium weinanense]MBU3125060.1 NAD(P)H-dependent oxidoreductase [Sinomicrobium weinanense]
MNIIEQLRWRYATKKFDAARKLEDNQIETLKEAFNLTALSFGLQPVKLVILSDQEKMEELLPHAFGQQQVVDASHLFVFCIEKVIDEEFIRSYFDKVKAVRNTSEEILKPYRDFLIADFNKKTSEEIEAWARNQAYLAMGNLLTVCAVEKIDACPMEGFLPDKFDKVLKLGKEGLKSVLIMPVGYRSEQDECSTMEKVRKEISESVIEIR